MRISIVCDENCFECKYTDCIGIPKKEYEKYQKNARYHREWVIRNKNQKKILTRLSAALAYNDFKEKIREKTW